ncbi:SAM-dependent methyltransferase [Actinomadura rugatobispora]|uniref:SAM-dependent methyltransferase n=1 Tax=Actinomadura rugatobispora TaxID=1994 RepID=A0ABW0ZTA7_9ACTN
MEERGGGTIAGVDASVPNVARIYDYLLGGKDHYAADREAAERLLAAAPETLITVRENRAFLRRAVRRLAQAGIRQFVDFGSGLPTRPNVHEVAQEVDPGARVVYSDNDPVVVTHGRALLASAPGVTVVQGDVRDPEAILDDPATRELIDLSQPVAVLLLAVLHFVTDEQDPAGVVRLLRARMAPGSALVFSHVTSEGNRPEAAGTARTVYDASTASIALRSRPEIAVLMDGFELEEPGLVYAPEWWPDGGPDDPAHAVDPAGTFLFAAVGRR